MTGENLRRATLEEIREMDERGELFRDPNAPEGPELGKEFWAKAVLEEPQASKSVHLRLDPEVFDHFYQAANGKGHLTKMQAVLKAYVKAQKAA